MKAIEALQKYAALESAAHGGQGKAREADVGPAHGCSFDADVHGDAVGGRRVKSREAQASDVETRRAGRNRTLAAKAAQPDVGVAVLQVGRMQDAGNRKVAGAGPNRVAGDLRSPALEQFGLEDARHVGLRSADIVFERHARRGQVFHRARKAEFGSACPQRGRGDADPVFLNREVRGDVHGRARVARDVHIEGLNRNVAPVAPAGRFVPQVQVETAPAYVEGRPAVRLHFENAVLEAEAADGQVKHSLQRMARAIRGDLGFGEVRAPVRVDHQIHVGFDDIERRLDPGHLEVGTRNGASRHPDTW